MNKKKIVGETMGVRGGRGRGGCPSVVKINAAAKGHITTKPITKSKIKRFFVMESPLAYTNDCIEYKKAKEKNVQ
ncbi:MAG: hypothetical protein BroJett018_21250 [Chloroflexota bacterium]|nr:MAG: hypothetical protein BroJett018_21250 [Chloroflexota bacterium]